MREKAPSQRSLRALIFPLPSLRAPRVYFSQGATVGGLCGGESDNGVVLWGRNLTFFLYRISYFTRQDGGITLLLNFLQIKQAFFWNTLQQGRNEVYGIKDHSPGIQDHVMESESTFFFYMF